MRSKILEIIILRTSRYNFSFFESQDKPTWDIKFQTSVWIKLFVIVQRSSRKQFLHFTNSTCVWISSILTGQRIQLEKEAMCFPFDKVPLSLRTSQSLPSHITRHSYCQVRKLYLRSAKDMPTVVTTHLWRHTSFQVKSAASSGGRWKKVRTTNNTNRIFRQNFIKINVFNDVPPFSLAES